MDLPEKVYISEDLTKKASEINFHAKKMVKTYEIWSTFTMNRMFLLKLLRKSGTRKSPRPLSLIRTQDIRVIFLYFWKPPLSGSDHVF